MSSCTTYKSRVYRGLASLNSSQPTTLSRLSSRIPQPAALPALATTGLRTYNSRSQPVAIPATSTGLRTYNSRSIAAAAPSVSAFMPKAHESIQKHVERLRAVRAASSSARPEPRLPPPQATTSRVSRSVASHVERIQKARVAPVSPALSYRASTAPRKARQASSQVAKNVATDAVVDDLARVTRQLESLVISATPAIKSCLRHGTSTRRQKRVTWKYQDLIPGYNIHEVRAYRSVDRPSTFLPVTDGVLRNSVLSQHVVYHRRVRCGLDLEYRRTPHHPEPPSMTSRVLDGLCLECRFLANVGGHPTSQGEHLVSVKCRTCRASQEEEDRTGSESEFEEHPDESDCEFF
ncbi:hypothetical protein B7463_g7226, partial [Scytalidium lignicola]